MLIVATTSAFVFAQQPASAMQASTAGLTPSIEMVDAVKLKSRIESPAARTRVFNFWATWCGPCRAEIPTLSTLAVARSDVEVILVNLDLPSLRASHVEPFLKRATIDGLQLLQLDEEDPVAALQEVVDGWPDQIPVTLVVAPSGERTHMFTTAISLGDLTQAVKSGD